MGSLLKRRPSPAMVVAVIALMAALFGTAYAAKKINGGSIKNSSIPGKKLKNDTVTGGKVSESTLAGVDAAKLGGLASSAFQPSGAVLGGAGVPTEISQVMFTVPDVGLQVETDAVATTLNQVVMRNVGTQGIDIVFGNGPGDDIVLSGSGSSSVISTAASNEFDPGVASFEVLAVTPAAISVVNCFFPNDANVGFDYCQATTEKS
jgi:hypothetical protein